MITIWDVPQSNNCCLEPSKRKADALKWAKTGLLQSIKKLCDVERRDHDLANIASDFVEKNKDILDLCSDEGPDIADMIPGSSTAESHGIPTDKCTAQSLALREGPETANSILASSAAESHDIPTDKTIPGSSTAESHGVPTDKSTAPSSALREGPDTTNSILPSSMAESHDVSADKPTSNCAQSPDVPKDQPVENQPTPALCTEDKTTPDVDITPLKTREASLAADGEHDRKNKRKHVQETESESGHGVKVHKRKKHTTKFKRNEDKSSDMDDSESSNEDDSESSDEDSDESMASKKKAYKHKHKWRRSKKSKKQSRGCAYLHVVSLPHLNSMSQQNVVATERRESVSVVFCFIYYHLTFSRNSEEG